MVRITAQLLSAAEQRVNPLQDRELVLSGLGIVAIENMAAAADHFDCWDLSNNFLTVLDNFPKRKRLSHLLLSNNRISTFMVQNLINSGVGANLRTITLSNNNIESLQQIANLAKACPKLEFLTLTGNPVTRRQHYRLYTIHCMPSTLNVLDYVKIKPAERDRASRLANSAAGAALQSDIQQGEQHEPKTFVPGASEDAGGNASSRSFVTASFTAQEKEGIRQLLAKAESVQQFEEIENAVRQGILPPGAAAIAAKIPNGNGSTENENDADKEETASKRRKMR